MLYIHDITTRMIIMGVDPGIARVGWAVIQMHAGTLIARSYGCVETQKTLDSPARLSFIYDTIAKLLRKHKPDCMAVEELYFSTNAKTAIGVGQSRGVILLIAAKTGIPVISYSPLAVKRAICGDGKADKRQVGTMVTKLLSLKSIPKLDDTADALAIAMTHAYSYKMKRFAK